MMSKVKVKKVYVAFVIVEQIGLPYCIWTKGDN